MIHLLYGGNALGILRRLQELKDEADGGSGMLATNYLSIDGREAKPHEILGPAMSPPFLAPQRLVVVENLLERFEQSGEQRAARSLEPQKPLLEGLRGGLPGSTALVFVAHRELRRNPLLAELKKLPGASDEPYPALKKDEISRFIRDEAAAHGLRLRNGPPKRPHPANEEWEREARSDPAVLLAILTNGDTLRIASEVQKLALYTIGREATVDDVYELVGSDREVQTLAWCDLVMDGRLYDALDGLDVLRREPKYDSDAGVLAVLLSRYRALAQVIDLQERGASLDEIAKTMGRAGQYANLVKRATDRAHRIGPAGLRTAYAAIVEADRTHKLGEVDEEVATEILLGKLAR